MELIISQEQFKQNQKNGRMLRAIKENKKNNQKIIEVSKWIIAMCVIGLAIMFFGIIGA